MGLIFSRESRNILNLYLSKVPIQNLLLFADKIFITKDLLQKKSAFSVKDFIVPYLHKPTENLVKDFAIIYYLCDTQEVEDNKIHNRLKS